MQTISRTWEKVLAWIANVLLLLITGAVSLVSFSGAIDQLNNYPEFRRGLEEAVAEQSALTGGNVAFTPEELMNILETGLKVISIFAIVVLIVAIIATFLMKKRVLSAVLFLIVAIATAVGSFGNFWFIALLYLIVSIMLFVRKEEKKSNNDQDGTIGYV